MNSSRFPRFVVPRRSQFFQILHRIVSIRVRPGLLCSLISRSTCFASLSSRFCCVIQQRKLIPIFFHILFNCLSLRIVWPNLRDIESGIEREETKRFVVQIRLFDYSILSSTKMTRITRQFYSLSSQLMAETFFLFLTRNSCSIINFVSRGDSFLVCLEHRVGRFATNLPAAQISAGSFEARTRNRRSYRNQFLVLRAGFSFCILSPNFSGNAKKQ